MADYDGSYTYGCGTTINNTKANYNQNNPLNLSSYPHTSPVDHYSSYGYGMNDMAGNVWEWTETVFYNGHRIMRGGAYDGADYFCTVSMWHDTPPDATGDDTEFRVCR